MKFAHKICIAFLCFAETQSFAQTAPGLDINDVAVLFPLDVNHQPFPRMTLDDNAGLVTADEFKQVMDAAMLLNIKAPLIPVATPMPASIDKLSDWGIISFRYDPCSPREHAGPDAIDCVPELRLVAQPLYAAAPADSALHLIYSLGDSAPQANDEALNEILKLKAAAETRTGVTSSGLPLGVHPTLSAALAGRDSEVASYYLAFIRRFARAENLKKITMMGLEEGRQTQWTFFGGNVIGGRWSQESIPNLPDNPKLFVELNLNSANVFAPTPADILSSTFGFFNRQVLLEGEFELLKDGLHRLANPLMTNRNNSDCLSCHSATSLQTNANTRAKAYVEGLTAVPARGITAYPAPGLLNRHRSHWNLHALGYFGTEPSLSLHSVNEAGRSAAIANATLQRQNPGPDCSAVQKEVISCFFNASANPIAGSGTADCLKVCSAAPGKPSAPNDNSITAGTFQIVSKFSNKCLDVVSGSRANGAKYQQMDCSAAPTQKLVLEALSGSNRYRIRNLDNGRCLDITDGSKANGARLQQWDCSSGVQQTFEVTGTADNASIRSVSSGLCIDISGPSTANLAAAQQWTCSGSANQTWMLKR